MTWHPEILGRRQRRVLAEIGPLLTERGFYLAGGTAVALHLGHRRSVDLDWFAPIFPDSESVTADFRQKSNTFTFLMKKVNVLLCGTAK